MHCWRLERPKNYATLKWQHVIQFPHSEYYFYNWSSITFVAELGVPSSEFQPICFKLIHGKSLRYYPIHSQSHAWSLRTYMKTFSPWSLIGWLQPDQSKVTTVTTPLIGRVRFLKKIKSGKVGVFVTGIENQ